METRMAGALVSTVNWAVGEMATPNELLTRTE